MRITQNLRKPVNWQDFESLCLLLWREEWKSEDIKKNGRNGQVQNGVDICGHRENEDEYSAIQCKCKADGEVLSKDEVAAEIEKARNFSPPLKRFIIATTVKKDAALEEFVRLKDSDNRKAGLFSVDIKSWEDIVDMLERHKAVLNTYLDLVTDDYSVIVSFDNGAVDMEIKPVYQLVKYETSNNKGEKAEKELAINDMYPAVTPRYFQSTRKTNYSFSQLKVKIHNDGSSPLDDLKLILHFDCPKVKFLYANVEEIGMNVMNPAVFDGLNSNVSFEGQDVIIEKPSLTPLDKAVSDPFFVKVPYETSQVNIDWQLLSRHYNRKGRLHLKVSPSLFPTVREDPTRAGRQTIRDYILVEDRY